MNAGFLTRAAVCAALVATAGCAGYSWKSSVPEEMRSVAVPTFRNESNLTGLGVAVAKQVGREFQREGTFRLADVSDCAVEVQGVVKSSSHKSVAYDRSVSVRMREYDLRAVAEVSIIDKKSGKVLVDNRRYRARTTFLAGDDVLTGERDATGRLAEDLARQIVDDVLNCKW
jgi:hypothetical protein